MLSEVILPNGQKYVFKYTSYGEIARIDYPTGACERFIYGNVRAISWDYELNSFAAEGYGQANRGVVDRYVAESVGAAEQRWQYGVSYVTTVHQQNTYLVTTTAPDNTVGKRYLHRSRNPMLGSEEGTYGFDTAVAGMEMETQSLDSNGVIRSRKLFDWEVTWAASVGAQAIPERDARVKREISIIFEPGASSALATMSETVYDITGHTDPAYFSSLNAKQSKTYNYAVVDLTTAQTASLATISTLFNSSNLAATSETDYLYDANYKARNINGLATETRIKDPSGNLRAKTQITYDGLSLLSESTSTRWENPNTNYRGLVTKTRSWHDIANNLYIDTQAQYDLMGNLRYATDGRDNVSETQYSSTYDYAYPTDVKTPIPDSSGVNGSNTALQSSTVYDYNTGLPTSATDANGQTSYMEYNDSLLRPTKVTAPNGHQTITEYGAGTSESTRSVKVRSQIDSSSWSEGISWYDGHGRTYRSERVDSQGNIHSDTEYDSMGRVRRTSNPYRSGEAVKWTTNSYDAAGRLSSVSSTDNAVASLVYGLSTSTPIGTTKTVVDQAGKKRKAITDALGRTIRVIEDPDSSAPVTDYVFDTLGNLRKTTQGEQNRYFMHDSLGRLLYAKQPEQDTNSALIASDPVTGNTAWSVKYVYDANSNIVSTTDARNQSATATYDNLNRIMLRDYSDGLMPDVSFYYDGKYLDANDIPQTATGSVNGKTTGIKSSVSRTNSTSFDSMGRLLTHQQITDGQTYGTAYTYNLSGALIEETYPSGRVVRNTLDQNGDLSQVQSKKNANYGLHTYAGNFSYDSAGAVKKMQLGNGRWETSSYNDLLQITQIGLGVTDATQDLLKLEYGYNTTGQTNNNGLLREQKITVPTVGSNPTFTATQTYLYDNLNRIQSAEEKISGATTWKQTFTIDRYGDRRYDAANTTTLGSCTQAQCNPLINTSDNRFSSGQGYSYDPSGNVTQDATGQRFQYDAENHQKAFFNANNGGSTPDWTYHYDGDGRRVKKVSPTETTVFVYDGGGLLVAEYSTALAPIQQVSYLTTDHLGTPRVITNENGIVTSRKDSMTFGGEAVSSQRVAGTTGNGYNPSNVRQDYTGYWKDSESGLEFAEARQYNSMHGRFTSVDPLNESGITGNPQTFNRYSYVANDPLNSVDPSGMSACSAEYSYSQCGGDAGFWGGEFGDHVAADAQYHGDTPHRSNSYSLYLQRVTNAQNGNGFRTSSEVEEAAAVAMFDTFYGDYDLGKAQAANPEFYAGALTVYQWLPRFDQIRNIFQDIGGALQDFTMPGSSSLINTISRAIWDTDLIHTKSKVYNDTDTIIAITTLPLPGPGGKAKAGKLGIKLAIHGAHHHFPRLGRKLAHIQLNTWRFGVKGSGKARRLPLPSKKNFKDIIIFETK